jgi:hemolysin activation/secretion protein
MNRAALLSGVAFAAMMLQAGVAGAQVPGSAEPGLIQRNLQPTVTRPDVSRAPLITVQEDKGAKELKGDISFVLKNIKLEGATQYGEEELKPIYADMLGQKITLGALNRVANDITAFYRNKGYILSRAVVPPQRIEGGDVTIRIVEGFVNDVRIEGEGADSATVQRFAEKIKNAKPLNAKALERYLLLMEDLPGVEARAVLQPSDATPGASDVVITLTRSRFEGSQLSFDNRGSRFLGPWQGGATLAVNNVLGMDEQTQVRAIGSVFELDELQYGEIRHEQQIGSEGTRLALAASHVRTRPGSSLEVLDIEGQSRTYSMGVSHPFLRTRQSNLFGNLDATIRDVDVSLAGGKFYEDRVRTLSAGGSYDFLDDWAAINRLGLNVTKGFGIDTESSNGARSRANGRPSFWKANFDYSRLQPISGPWTANFSMAGQYSLDPLLASEEFAIGGPAFGSAYDPAEITGDSGLAARIELQYNDSLNEKWLSAYQLYTFYDIGRVWNRDIIAATENATRSLSSVGVGSRFNLVDNLSGGVEVALPLTKTVSAFGDDGDAPRFFMSLQYRY